MKVLIADKFPESGQTELIKAGCEVVCDADLKDENLVDAIKSGHCDVLVVRSTKVTKSMLESSDLSLVVRAGAGYNTIDVETASASGIYVANCPGKNSIAVAELAFGLILALDRRISENVIDLRNGRWNKKEYSKARGLFGRTLGLIGVGRIGQEVITRAKTFGLRVVAWSRSLTAERAAELEIERMNSPIDVASASDIVSLHLALSAETRNLADEDFFEAMRPGAFFINTARAEIVDQPALMRAIRDKGIRAGLDVFAGEPSSGTGSVEDDLFKLDGVIGTHHIGASTEQAQQAISDETVRIVLEYKNTGHVPNVVNVARKSPATHMLVVRHFDRVGVLAEVFSQLKSAGINVQETENIVFEGAIAAVARIHLDQAPQQTLVESLKSSSDDIIDVSWLRL